MPKPLVNFLDRARGALVGLAAGAGAGTPPGDAPVRLAETLAEELATGAIDFRRIAERWAAIGAEAPSGLAPATRAGLLHLARHGAPLQTPVGPPSAGPLAHCVPVALAAPADPVMLVSGAYHAALLTDPDPRTAWATVAVVVAAARLLTRRDFVPDVIEALRVNDAPADLLAAARRVPLERADALTPGGDPVAAAETALWLAYHEPVAARGLEWVAARPTDPSAAAVAGALLGARDGAAALGERAALPGDETARLSRLADRLVGAPTGA